jgi:site-specific DNA-methyltransferase (adenine-specific)
MPARSRSYYKKIRGKTGSTITLYLGDSIAGMRENVSPDSVDVVVTSPPYNIGIRYGKHDDNLPRIEYLEWMESLGKEIKRVLDEDGSFFLNIGNTPTDQWIAWDVAQVLRKDFVL